MSKPKKNLEKARQIKGLGNSGLKNYFQEISSFPPINLPARDFPGRDRDQAFFLRITKNTVTASARIVTVPIMMGSR